MPLPGPDTRVTELRVPGLAGTSGGSLLDASDTVQVAGDPAGEVVRPADRLHRPSPGPVLHAPGRSVPRTLEGYLWSKMTSGGLAKASWVLLFPFTLANVAHWMLPPEPTSGHGARMVAAGCRALLRLGSLLLTMLLVVQVAVISTDLLAAQCLAPGSGCLGVVPSWLRHSVPFRIAVGVLPLLCVILLLHRVSGSGWHSDSTETAESPSRRENPMPADGLRAADNIAVLRCLHTGGTLAMLGVLLTGGPTAVPGGTAKLIVWSAGLALLISTLLGSLINPRDLGGRAGRTTLLLTAAVIACAAVFFGAPDRINGSGAGLSGTDPTVESIAGLLAVVCLLFAALLIPATLSARHRWRDRPKRLRPWAGGWAAAPALVLGCLLGGGFGAGTAIALRELLDGDGLGRLGELGEAGQLSLPESYSLITMLWGGALAILVLLAFAGFAIAIPLRRSRRGIPNIVRILHPDESSRAEAARAWARASWQRHWLHRLVLAFVLVMSAGAIALVVARYWLREVPHWLQPLSGIGVITLGILAVGLLRVILSAAAGSGGDRTLGAFVDLVSFWPRAAHPAVPPCYALKVIPDVTARAREHLAEPDNRVVLTGNHIGGILAAVAAGRLADSLRATDRERVGLVTAGCPLQWGFQRAFPAVFTVESLANLYSTLDGRWRGLCRGTDTFGGGATSWRHQVIDDRLLGVGLHSDGHTGALPAAAESSSGALVIGGDHWLPDPMHGPRVGHRWAPGVLGNKDYVADAEWDAAVAAAAGLSESCTPATSLAEQAALIAERSGHAARTAPGEEVSVSVPPDTEQDENCGTH